MDHRQTSKIQTKSPPAALAYARSTTCQVQTPHCADQPDREILADCPRPAAEACESQPPRHALGDQCPPRPTIGVRVHSVIRPTGRKARSTHWESGRPTVRPPAVQSGPGCSRHDSATYTRSAPVGRADRQLPVRCRSGTRTTCPPMRGKVTWRK